MLSLYFPLSLPLPLLLSGIALLSVLVSGLLSSPLVLRFANFEFLFYSFTFSSLLFSLSFVSSGLIFSISLFLSSISSISMSTILSLSHLFLSSHVLGAHLHHNNYLECCRLRYVLSCLHILFTLLYSFTFHIFFPQAFASSRCSQFYISAFVKECAEDHYAILLFIKVNDLGGKEDEGRNLLRGGIK